uniref:L,D-transpeptidase family protein n=1 Tax=Pararhizobium sp. IMCC3301 TaxID=3067904 RepID=UPI0027411BA8|nr:L,D-transpeptidase [Pararhizobium sp. IMCC3301]
MKKSLFITGMLTSCAYVLLAMSLAMGQTPLTQDAIEAATPGQTLLLKQEEGSAPNSETGSETGSEAGPKAEHEGPSALVARVQIALDRAGFSVGVIDGFAGDNYASALVGFQSVNQLEVTGTVTPETWELLVASFGDAVMQTYTLTAEDLAMDYIAEVPSDYSEKAKLKALSYTSPVEMLSERFHMDENFLRALNPSATFANVGEVLLVASPMRPIENASVKRIIVDGKNGRVQAYDAEGLLVAMYPATVGSESTPSPSGTHEVVAVAENPTYTYNPKINFTQGDNKEVLTIAAGPNGPVGSIWIDLSKPTYGIHGTPDPSKIAKTQSNGCVRLTNWDAAELAKLVSTGTIVEFLEGS